MGDATDINIVPIANNSVEAGDNAVIMQNVHLTDAELNIIQQADNQPIVANQAITLLRDKRQDLRKGIVVAQHRIDMRKNRSWEEQIFYIAILFIVSGLLMNWFLPFGLILLVFAIMFVVYRFVTRRQRNQHEQARIKNYQMAIEAINRRISGLQRIADKV
jgi:Flp pilus assembly protein TadB